MVYSLPALEGYLSHRRPSHIEFFSFISLSPLYLGCSYYEYVTVCYGYVFVEFIDEKQAFVVEFLDGPGILDSALEGDVDFAFKVYFCFFFFHFFFCSCVRAISCCYGVGRVSRDDRLFPCFSLSFGAVRWFFYFLYLHCLLDILIFKLLCFATIIKKDTCCVVYIESYKSLYTTHITKAICHN